MFWSRAIFADEYHPQPGDESEKSSGALWMKAYSLCSGYITEQLKAALDALWLVPPDVCLGLCLSFYSLKAGCRLSPPVPVLLQSQSRLPTVSTCACPSAVSKLAADCLHLCLSFCSLQAGCRLSPLVPVLLPPGLHLKAAWQ